VPAFSIAFSVDGNFTPVVSSSTLVADSAAVRVDGEAVLGDVWTVDLSGTSYGYAVRALVTLSGAPQDLEDWTVVVNGVAFTYEANDADGTLDTLAQIAAALAGLIDAHADYSATAAGAAVVIGSATSPVAPLTVSTAITPVSGASLGTMQVASADTLADVAAGLAAAINDAAAGLTATARDTTLVVATAAGSFVLDTTVTPEDGAAAVSPTVDAHTLTLTGTPGQGQAWTLTVDGMAITHVVTSGQARSQIAGALAALVNAGPSGYAAVAEGDAIVIFKLVAGALATSLDAAPANSAAVRTTALGSSVAHLNDSANAGETWSVTVGGGTYSVEIGTVLATDAFGEVTDTLDTAAEVALFLARLINADNWSAVITLLRSPAVGDVWSVTVAGMQFDVTLTAAASRAQVASQLAAAINAAAQAERDEGVLGDPQIADLKALADGDVLYVGTLSGEAESVVFAVTYIGGPNDSDWTLEVPANFVAAADGDALVIVNTASAELEPEFSITPSGAGVVDATGTDATLATLQGTVLAGETWYVFITLGDVIHAFSHTVVGTQTLEQVALGLAGKVNLAALQGLWATTEGTTLILIGSGQAPRTAYEIARGDGSTVGGAAFDARTASDRRVDLSGTPAEGESWQLTVRAGAQTVEIAYTVQAGDDLEDIAAGLAAALNAFGAPGFVAVAEGASLVVVDRAGRGFTLESAIEPVRRPAGNAAVDQVVVAGNTAIVTLGGTVRVDGVEPESRSAASCAATYACSPGTTSPTWHGSSRRLSRGTARTASRPSPRAPRSSSPIATSAACRRRRASPCRSSSTSTRGPRGPPPC
jgi:hypothetical protein